MEYTQKGATTHIHGIILQYNHVDIGLENYPPTGTARRHGWRAVKHDLEGKKVIQLRKSLSGIQPIHLRQTGLSEECIPNKRCTLYPPIHPTSIPPRLSQPHPHAPVKNSNILSVLRQRNFIFQKPYDYSP